MAPTKRMLNRAMDAAGFRLAVEAGLDLGAIINAADTPEQREWDAIVRRDGLKAALAWRDRRYDERLGGGEPAMVECLRTDPIRMSRDLLGLRLCRLALNKPQCRQPG